MSKKKGLPCGEYGKVMILPSVYALQVTDKQMQEMMTQDASLHGLAGSATNELAGRRLLTSLLELGAAGCHSQKKIRW